MRKIVSERKIKHWQGYGSVDAKVLRKTPDNLIVQVRGMHEYGLDCGAWNHDRVYEWLVKRFDPTKTERDIVSVDIDDEYERQGNVDIEVCTYDISFKEKSTFELVQESADNETLKDIERAYGKKTALALDKYCKLFKKTPTNVVSDLKADGNGMTEWDKFDVWARRKLKVDIMGNFDDTVDWTGASDDENCEKKEREIAKPKRMAKVSSRRAKNRRKPRFSEGSGSRMTQWDIASWISDEVRDCEWADGVDFENDDYEDPWFRITTTDGDTFQVVVKKV